MIILLNAMLAIYKDFNRLSEETNTGTFIKVILNVNDQNKVREKSRECHIHKPKPFSDTKRKRKQTYKRTKSTKISSLSSPSEVIAILKGLKTQEQNNTRQDLIKSPHPNTQTECLYTGLS